KSQKSEEQKKENVEKKDHIREEEGEKEELPEEEEGKNEEEDEQEAKINDMEKKIENLNDKYLRLFSEFDNYKKRTNKEKQDIIKNAGADIIRELLPVLDDFDRALESNELTDEDDEQVKKIKEGYKLIYQKFKNTLEQRGVKEMKAEGEEFDSELHEAMTKMPAPSKDMKGKVVEVAQKGYYLNDKVLRHAKVVVGE
ncbi:MAG: nucleotide exchange factor GrpE, partial [Flavobacteriales bacterium]